MAVKTKAEEKKSNLEELFGELNKKYGPGTIMKSNTRENLEVISSGSFTLDRATDIGGIPIGKLIEIYGPESSGKSTVTLHIIAEFQKAGKKCALIDTEQSYDKKYATALGVNIDDLLIVQAENGEDYYNIVERLIRTKEIGLVVIDSHTGLAPKKMVDGEVGDATMALQARMNSSALLKIHPLLMPNKCTVIAISQLRVNIGAYGDPNSPTGGLAYKFYSDMRLKVAKQISKETEANKTTVVVIKNKCGVPYNEASFLINWGTGIDRTQEIVDIAIEKGIITVGGSWYTFLDQKMQGMEAVKEYLNSHPEVLKQIEKDVL